MQKKAGKNSKKGLTSFFIMDRIASFQDYIRRYGLDATPSNNFSLKIMDSIISVITGYNHRKYWRRREYVVDKSKSNIFKKLYYLLYIKWIDSKKLSTFGTTINDGASFAETPLLPHGLNGIIVGKATAVGKNCTIFQQVTIQDDLGREG